MKRTLIGMLTPSSNTVLEPVTALLLADSYPRITAHFARFRVTTISLDTSSLGQFDQAPILAAADLLADARVDVIAWNDTSASWLGFERDEALCGEIEARTGTPATSAILGLNDLLARSGARRIGLVSPYVKDVQDRIVENYRDAGIEVVAESHLGISDNHAFSEVDENTIERMCRDVAASAPDAIVILCTNLRGAVIAPRIEAELGVPILDSVAFTLWKALDLIGEDGGLLRRWGSSYA